MTTQKLWLYQPKVQNSHAEVEAVQKRQWLLTVRPTTWSRNLQLPHVSVVERRRPQQTKLAFNPHTNELKQVRLLSTLPSEENRPNCSAVEPASRDPLPDRPGRNVHPAGKLPKRRTPQEVAAERDAKARAIEQKIRELEDAKRQLAEMNASEDMYDDEMDKGNPQRLSAATRKCAYDELEANSDDGEAFDFSEVDDMLGSSDAEEPLEEKIVSDFESPMQDSLRLTGCFSPRRVKRQLKALYEGRFKIWWGESMRGKMGVKVARGSKRLLLSSLINSHATDSTRASALSHI
jgi:hypothetical protein